MTKSFGILGQAATAAILSIPFASPGVAQAGPAGGFRLYGAMSQTTAHLVDSAGTIVHTWPGAYRPGLGVYLLPDGSLLRAVMVGSSSGPGGGGGVQRVAFDGSVLWDFRYNGPGVLSHHDIEPLPNGNVLLIAWEDRTPADVIGLGRDPVLISGPVFRADHVVEVRPTGPTTGAIVWEWHVLDHVVQDFDPSKANYGNVASQPRRIDVNYPPIAETSDDWNHFNGIDYDPVNDWIVLSAHTQDEIWIVDHGTTTAEAAGSSGGRRGCGGDLLYRWGNPAAYRAGSLDDQQLFGQHAPTFVPVGQPGAGNIVVFNNSWQLRRSAVFEIVLPLDAQGNFVMGPGGRYGPTAPVWTYDAPDFFSPLISSAERLPNGNTLVCSGAQRWLFEVTPGGQRVWEHRDPAGFIFHAHYYEHSLWASAESIAASTGGSVRFDLVAGSPNAQDAYLLLCSGAGTAPGTPLLGRTLPLNVDAFLLLSLQFANAAPAFARTFGSLDARGAANAGFALAPGLLPPGVELDFAFAVFDVPTLGVTATSNPIHVAIRP